MAAWPGIRILSSRAESISHSFASLTRERYFQHEKIKFVSPRGHVISSIYFFSWQSHCNFFFFLSAGENHHTRTVEMTPVFCQ